MILCLIYIDRFNFCYGLCYVKVVIYYISISILLCSIVNNVWFERNLISNVGIIERRDVYLNIFTFRFILYKKVIHWQLLAACANQIHIPNQL